MCVGVCVFVCVGVGVCVCMKGLRKLDRDMVNLDKRI